MKLNKDEMVQIFNAMDLDKSGTIDYTGFQLVSMF